MDHYISNRRFEMKVILNVGPLKDMLDDNVLIVYNV